jgi:CRISPR-associated protein Csy3
MTIQTDLITTPLKNNPTVLAFEGKLVCSDALMMAGNWNNIDKSEQWQPVRVQSKSVRGTISNRDERSDIEHNDYAKFIKDIANPNIQTVDNAALPFDSDTLKVSFTLRILGNLAKPSACNIPAYQAKLAAIINDYQEEYQFKELAQRYAKNIANGRFLWRNRVCAESVEIHAKIADDILVFNAYHIGMKDFKSPENQADKENLNKLASIIQEGLIDSMGESFSFIEVDAFVKLGNGQMVYPSQEMVMEKAEKGGKSKYLYKLHDAQLGDIAAMHSQKIGNALRTIDDWHSKGSEVGAIAVEPYGSVTNQGEAYRPKSSGAFYTLLDNWMLKDKKPTEDERHFIMAVLIRGGVFSDQAKDEKEAKSKKEKAA